MNFYQIIAGSAGSFGANPQYEALGIGLFHGILFSFPLSVPFLISYRAFLLKRWGTGFVSFCGTIVGQIIFFILLFFGPRPLIQFWYTMEPFLSFIGIALICKLATEFYHETSRQLRDGITDYGRGQPAGATRSAASSRHGLLAGSEKLHQPSFLSKWGQVFFFQFFIIFLNPIFPALVTRTILSQDILSILVAGYGGFEALHSPALSRDLLFPFFTYCVGFIFGSFSSIVFFVSSLFVIFSILKFTNGSFSSISRSRFASIAGYAGNILKEAREAFRRSAIGALLSASRSSKLAARGSASQPALDAKRYLALDTSAGEAAPDGREAPVKRDSAKRPFQSEGNVRQLNNFFVFVLFGSAVYGSLQYSWRFVTQYPIEFLSFGIPRSGRPAALRDLSSEGEALPASTLNAISQFSRQFGTQDSNIRHREKPLPVERHLPIERINTRRTLSGRPPLNNEQKSDAYIKYNSFFLNKIEHYIDDLRIYILENGWLPAGRWHAAALDHAGYGREARSKHGWIPFNMRERFAHEVDAFLPQESSGLNSASGRDLIKSRKSEVVHQWVPCGTVDLIRANHFIGAGAPAGNRIINPKEDPTQLQAFASSAGIDGYGQDAKRAMDAKPDLIAQSIGYKNDTKGKPKFAYVRRLTNFLDSILIKFNDSTIEDRALRPSRASQPATPDLSVARNLSTENPILNTGREARDGRGRSHLSFSSNKSFAYIHDDFLIELAVMNLFDESN